MCWPLCLSSPSTSEVPAECRHWMDKVLEMNLIRRATMEDAAVIAAVQVAAWKSAYSGLVDQELLDGMSAAALTAGWRGQMIANRPSSGLWVATTGGDVAGYANFGPSQDPDATEMTGEVMAIYVRPSSWSTGAGSALLERMVTEMKSAGFDEATLWVLTANKRARAFYGRAGWASDGNERRHRIESTFLQEVRYRTSLL